jgi:hypothetical protein
MGTLEDAWCFSLVFVVVCFGAQAHAQGTNPNDGEGLTMSKPGFLFLFYFILFWNFWH